MEPQVTDLGKQVTTLVQDVDGGRGSGHRQSPRERQQQQVDNTVSADSVIEGRLEEKTAEVRQELDTAFRQVEELRTTRERQQLMVENIIQQKEMYRCQWAGGCHSNEVGGGG